jgi:hypothetical protein
MTVPHGSSSKVLFDEYDLSTYFNQVNASRQIQAVNTTTFANTGSKSYIAGLETGSLSIQGLWDGSAAAVDAVLDSAIGAESVVTIGLSGYDTIGASVVMAKGENISYQIRSTTQDAVRITAGGQADGGVRMGGVVLHDLAAETTTLNETSVDSTASSANGGVGHIHVTAFSGTDATVKIQDSANDADWADLIEFGQITNTGSERALVSGTVDRYLRFAITTDNFTSMTIFCSFARNRR